MTTSRIYAPIPAKPGGLSRVLLTLVLLLASATIASVQAASPAYAADAQTQAAAAQDQDASPGPQDADAQAQAQAQAQARATSPRSIAATVCGAASSWLESFAYCQLDEADREKYDIMLRAFATREPQGYPEADMDDLARIRECVQADHPELFYVSGVRLTATTNQLTGAVTDVVVEGQFTCSADEVGEAQAALEAASADWLADVPAFGGDYAKAKHLYEELALRTEYDHAAAAQNALGASSGQGIADVMLSGKAVCAGYARTYQHLLRQLRIPCMYITGVANGGPHAWCAAWLDGSWYLIDPTWGDSQFFDEGGQAGDSGFVDYDYLCLTTADMALTHEEGSSYPVPDCMRMEDNYYVREGLFLEDADAGRAGDIIERAMVEGRPTASFRCASDDVYGQLVDQLFDGREVFRFTGTYSCRYLLNADFRTVTVIF